MNSVSIVLRMAWRNLWRHYRRTLVMLGAVTVGVWAMIFMTALSRGMIDDMVQSSFDTLLGHAQIHQIDYLDDPAVNNSIDMPGMELRRELNRAEQWTQRLRVPAVISSERETMGIVLVGIDPEPESKMSFVASQITQGRYLDHLSDTGILIGAKLAETLETELGKRIVLMSQNLENEVVDRGFRIVGIYEADLDAIEEQFVFVGLSTAQELLEVGERVTEIELRDFDYRNVQPLVDSLSPFLGENMELLRWDQIDTYLGTMVSMMDGWVLIWVLIIFSALSFGLVNTLAMAVFERVRELGLMLALGMKPIAIWFLVVLEALMLLVLGLALGNALAWASIEALSDGIDVSAVSEGMEMAGYGTVVHLALYPQDMILASIIVLVLGVFASALPAWHAARLEPILALTRN